MSPLPSDGDRWQAWDSFLEATPDTGFMQSSWWAMTRSPVGFEYFAVTLKDGNTIVGGALVAKWAYAPGRCFYYMQDGPVLPADEAAAGQVFAAILGNVEQHRRAEEETVSHLRIEPRWRRLPGFVRGFEAPAFEDPYREPRDTLCIDLRPPEQEILAQMKPKGRYNIRVAQRLGVTIVEDASDRGIADFLRIQRRTAVRQGMERKPPRYFRTLASVFSSARKLSIFFAEYRGRRIATALVVYFGRRATYLFGGSLDLHRRVMAPYLLHFEIMRKARALGCEWYDLWGVAPENQPDHRWRNISNFKRKFGGVEVCLVPTLDYVYDPAAYEQYAAATRKSARVPNGSVPVSAPAVLAQGAG
jgi:lipid II:glycine glycyltransferase (peptidoglycan interpeptide bridge formation enzyme)